MHENKPATRIVVQTSAGYLQVTLAYFQQFDCFFSSRDKNFLQAYNNLFVNFKKSFNRNFLKFIQARYMNIAKQ